MWTSKFFAKLLLNNKIIISLYRPCWIHYTPYCGRNVFLQNKLIK